MQALQLAMPTCCYLAPDMDDRSGMPSGQYCTIALLIPACDTMHTFQMQSPHVVEVILSFLKLHNVYEHRHAMCQEPT